MSMTDTETIVGNQADTDLDILEEQFAEQLRSTHIVTPEENKTVWMVLGGGMDVTAQDIVDFCRNNNVMVMAICGYKWIPKNNPEKYDMCDACREEAGNRMKENNE